MDEKTAIGAVVDEMYAMISGPAGPRDWSRQKAVFADDARQMRTGVDEDGRPWMKAMSPAEYQADTNPFFMANPFFEVEIVRRSTCWETWPTSGASTRRALLPTTRHRSGGA